MPEICQVSSFGVIVMNKICSLVLILVSIACNTGASQELMGEYTGNTSKDFTYIVYMNFKDHHYSLSIDANPKDNEFGIPYKYFIKTGEYYYYEETGTWNIIKEKELDYIYLKSETGFTYQKKLGILYSRRRLYLYDLKNQLFFDGNDSFKRAETMPWVDTVKTSSFLIEGDIEYTGNNLYPVYMKDSNLPWVEGVKGPGIGEWVEMKLKSIGYPVSSFLISNGYVDFGKPYLYDFNSRVKRLRITSKELNIDFKVELEDTPNFQEIHLPKEITELETTFRFTIMEVYPGTKWEDTCLNLIIPLGNLPNEK